MTTTRARTSPRTADRPVEVRGLRKTYGKTTAVDDVSFTVEPGEIVGILGPNGSGKTTTVECLQGLRRPDQGDVRVLGLDPRHQVATLRRRIGCQLQDAALPDRLRVGEAVRLFASVGDRRPDIDALLREWGLREKRRAPFGSLSGGQRQRLFVALALVNDPELVFLDEMTTGLDPTARRDAWRLVERVRDRGAAIVLVTHFMDEAERLCDRLVVLRDGAVVATGTPAELVHRHGGGLTASFSSDLPLPVFAELPGVRDVRRHGTTVEVTGEPAVVLRIGHLLVPTGHVPADLLVRQATLEDAYIRLVGDGTQDGTQDGADPPTRGDEPGTAVAR
ncbi:ABC transporter ATP-binding protein [Blastococcus jejuensis]|uniref:ABC transporter ATP-binding protein n=1 Tax=Blastococcus jejuensis TaxID=351224 RepID=A0ABP6P5S2_9ACTN